MVVLGCDEPMWQAVIRARGPELAVAVMAEAAGVRGLTLDVGPAGVIAAGEPTTPDRYATAWKITETLTELWGTVADDTVTLTVLVGSLRVDVPGRYFFEPHRNRRRWATLARSELVHGTVHEHDRIGLFSDKGAHHPTP